MDVVSADTLRSSQPLPNFMTWTSALRAENPIQLSNFGRRHHRHVRKPFRERLLRAWMNLRTRTNTNAPLTPPSAVSCRRNETAVASCFHASGRNQRRASSSPCDNIRASIVLIVDRNMSCLAREFGRTRIQDRNSNFHEVAAGFSEHLVR